MKILQPKLFLVIKQLPIFPGMLTTIMLDFGGSVFSMKWLKVQGAVQSAGFFVLCPNENCSCLGTCIPMSCEYSSVPGHFGGIVRADYGTRKPSDMILWQDRGPPLYFRVVVQKLLNPKFPCNRIGKAVLTVGSRLSLTLCHLFCHL
jgi:hypothetical protein